MNDTTPSSPTPPPPEDSSSAPNTPASSPPPPPAPIVGSGMDGKQWAMLLHLSQLAGVVVPGLGLVAPIVIWQIKKEQFPELDKHGKMVANWIISLLIYCVVLGAVTCGFGALLCIPPAIIFPILGGLKARDGIVWKYPITITFIK